MKRKKILITGIVSLLGKYLTNQLRSTYEIFGTIHNSHSSENIHLASDHFVSVEITNESQLSHCIHTIKPDIVIHLAAVSNIDYCESHPDTARAVNAGGTRLLCKILTDLNIHLLFVSSNAVFDGCAPPYDESAIPNPLNIYGQTKVAAECIILQSKLKATIIRCTSLFGIPPTGARDNDFTYYLQQLNQKKAIYLVNDLFFNPVYAATAATAIGIMIERGRMGIFHIAGKDRVTRFTFVESIINVLGIKHHPPLIPVTHDYFQKLAPRPKDATLSTASAQKILKIIPRPLVSELRSLLQETSSKYRSLIHALPQKLRGE